MTMNSRAFWTMLGMGLGVAAAELVRRTGPGLLERVQDAPKQVEAWAKPIIEEMVKTKDATMAKLESEYGVRDGAPAKADPVHSTL